MTFTGLCRVSLGQLVMWEELLTRGDDLLSNKYPFLEFGRLLHFQTDHGIDDEAWAASASTEPPQLDGQSAELFALL